MKITDLTTEFAVEVEKAWAAAVPQMVDNRRSTDHLAWLLLQSDSCWYQIEGHRAWLYLTDITPGLDATIHALNLDGWDAVASPKVADELAAIMAEHQLVRLTAVVPAPVGDLHRALKMIGFQKEGRMRKALVFNGRPTDAIIYGHLRQVEASESPRRRRRRRRKKWETPTQSEHLAAEASSAASRPGPNGSGPKAQLQPEASGPKQASSPDLIQLPALQKGGLTN